MLTGKKELLPLLMIGKLCTVLLSFSIIISTVEGKLLLDEGQTAPTTDRVRLCGIRLKQEIESICSLSNINTNGYYIPAVPTIIEPRRSSLHASSNERQQQQRLRTNNVQSRVARGVIEECCKKPCDRLQLLKYCASSEVKSATSTTTTTTTPSPSPVDHRLLKRTSSAESNNKSERPHNPEKPSLPQQSDSNCLHCALNKSRRNKKSSDCGKSRRRKIRRRKPHLSPSSDETRQDTFGSGESNFSHDTFYNGHRIQTHATQVTEGPQPEIFAISDGTYAESFTL